MEDLLIYVILGVILGFVIMIWLNVSGIKAR